MANEGVKGKLVDENGAPIPKLTVAVFDEDAIWDDALGKAETGNDGTFSVTYSAWDYGPLENPDIRIKVYDSVKRLIYETKKGQYPDVTDSTLDVGNITIHSKRHSGFLVSRDDGSTPFLRSGNSVEFLIDNEEAWKRLTQAVENAKVSIHFMQLIFDVPEFESDPDKESTNLITEFQVGEPTIGVKKKPPELGKQLEKELLEANRDRNPKVEVRMLLNYVKFPDFAFGYADSYREIKNYFEKANAHESHTVQIRYFEAYLWAVMHAKIVVIDGQEAFILGSPLLQEYYDDKYHKIDNPRRGDFSWLQNQIKIPIHDVNIYVKGPAVADLDEVFRIHWNQERPAGATELPAIDVPSAEQKNISLQVVRTLNGENRFDKVSEVSAEGETAILEGYLRAIRYADDFIYLENQYFTNPDIAEALYLAIKEKPNLQVIILTNNKVDAPLYGPLPIPIISVLFEGWHVNNIERLLENLTEEQRKRVGLFTSWTFEPKNPPAQPKPRIVRNYVHSKVAIVDDKWATVGCANLDSVSLKYSDHMKIVEDLTLGIKDYGETRASEVNVLIFNGVDGQPPTDAVDELRRGLWSKYLGYSNSNANDLQKSNKPSPGGWLKLWEDKGKENVANLTTNLAAGNQQPCHILPFPRKGANIPFWVGKSWRFFGLIGVDTDKLEVLDEVKDFSFEEGNWD